MNIEQSVLPNGLRVVSVNLPGFDSAAVGAFIKAGARNETEANNGIAHFLEHMAFKGTKTRTALQIGAEIEVLGSNINAYTSHDQTAYFVTGLKSTIAQSVAILGDVLTASTFEPRDIEVEKGVILQEIRRAADNPSHVAYEGYGHVAYPDQPLGRPILGPASIIEWSGPAISPMPLSWRWWASISRRSPAARPRWSPHPPAMSVATCATPRRISSRLPYCLACNRCPRPIPRCMPTSCWLGHSAEGCPRRCSRR